MFPYHDENATQHTPVFTVGLIALNLLAWVGLQGAGSASALAESVCTLGLIPGELTGAVSLGTRVPLGGDTVCVIGEGSATLNLFTSMFMHGSWMHLLGNMWFLWLFGNNIEDSMGKLQFLIFYLASGLAAAFAQVALDPASSIPMVGASGAISGVMGGYLILYPRVRVYTLVPLGLLLTSMALPAWTMLLYWMLIQFVGGLASIGSQTGGVAFWAHIGGFVAGVVLIKLFARPSYVTSHQSHSWRPTRTRSNWRSY